MLLFSTVLSINKSMTKDDFIKLVIEWNQSSPHKAHVIENINWNGERNIRFGDELLWLDIEEYSNENIIAVRYEICEANGSIWGSDFVMNFNDMKMAVKLDRSYTDDAMMDDFKFYSPYLIALLIDKGYLEEDGDLLCDAQVYSEYLAQMGFKFMPYDEYEDILNRGIRGE